MDSGLSKASFEKEKGNHNECYSMLCAKFKTRSEANVANHRPINISPVVSRVMEKAVKAAVV